LAKINLDFEFQYPFDVLGLVSSLKPYQMAWQLGKVLDADFELQKQAQIPLKNRDSIKILWFLAQNESFRYELLRNSLQNSPQPFLLPEFSHCDYLLKIESEFYSEPYLEVFDQIKMIGQLVWVGLISISELKKPDFLIFD
jgi:hypothetical protein